MTPKELISDIKQGFYVTDLIGSGVNGVTGDYSRGASGFWIENGEITYPVSEVTIAGHLLPMFKSLVAGQRSGIPLWRQRADAAHRGPDAWRPLIPPTRSGARCRAVAGHGARGRRAGLVAVSHRAEELDQGRLVAGLRSRYRRQRSGGKRLRAATPDYGWLSEESVDDDSASRQATGLDRRSDRRHPRLSRRPRRLVRQRGAGRRIGAGAGGGVRAGHREFFFAIRGQGATLNDAPVRATAGNELDFSRMAGPKPLVQRLSSSPDEITLHPRIGSLALRLCRVADGSLDAAFAGGQSRDWDLAAANLIVQEANGRMTALSGDAIEYNRREVVHGVLVAAGHDRHARIVEHFRNRPLP